MMACSLVVRLAVLIPRPRKWTSGKKEARRPKIIVIRPLAVVAYWSPGEDDWDGKNEAAMLISMAGG